MQDRRRVRKRGGADDDAPPLSERDRDAIDAIRRQLDAEYGPFGIPETLDDADDAVDDRPRADDRRRPDDRDRPDPRPRPDYWARSHDWVRPDGTRARLFLLILVIGGLGVALATAVLTRTPPPNVATSTLGPATPDPAPPRTETREPAPPPASTDPGDTAMSPAGAPTNGSRSASGTADTGSAPPAATSSATPNEAPPRAGLATHDSLSAPAEMHPEHGAGTPAAELNGGPAGAESPKLPPRPQALARRLPPPPEAGSERSPLARRELPSPKGLPPRTTTPPSDVPPPVPSSQPTPAAVARSVDEMPAGTSPSPAPAMSQREATNSSPMPPAAAAPPLPARAPHRPGMTPYTDPEGLFRIEYPAGWQVRPQTAPGRTAFYLDDPDEGVAVTVQAQGSVPGRVEGSALTPAVLRQLKERYPDIALVLQSSQLLADGTQRSDFTAQWTNRWAQRMRAAGRIVSVPRDGHTAYVYVAGQAHELVFPAVEPILLRMLDSFRATPKG